MPVRLSAVVILPSLGVARLPCIYLGKSTVHCRQTSRSFTHVQQFFIGLVTSAIYIAPSQNGQVSACWQRVCQSLTTGSGVCTPKEKTMWGVVFMSISNSSAKDPSCQTCLLVPFTPPNTLPRCPRGKLERLIHATPVTDHSHHRKAQAASSTIPHDSFLQLPAVISTAALPTHSSLFIASTRTTSRYHGLNGRGLALGSPPDLEIWR